MYQERLFETWQIGLLHLVISISMPIMPIIIYMLTSSFGNGYLYVLLLTVIVSFLHEYMSFPKKKCSTLLKIENIVCCISLIVMLIWTLFLLLLTYADTENITENIKTANIILVSLFGIPIISTLVEIGRCIVHDVESNKYHPDETNLVKGASKV